MRFELDHIAVAGTHLSEAVSYSEAALVMPLGPGGQHAHYGTHNRLLGLSDGLYLEAIAIDPDQPAPPYPRWFGLDHFSGPARLDKWILRCEDIDAARDRFPEAGSPVKLARGDLRWTMLVPDTGALPFDGVFPAIIEWHSVTPPGASLPATDRALTQLTVCHPQADLLAERLRDVFEDARVVFEPGAKAGLRAEFKTGTGACLTL